MTRNILKNLVLIFIGSVLIAISINSFTVPNGLGEGGVTGLTIILYYLARIPTAISIFVLNLIVLAIGYRYLDRETIVYTLIANFFITVALHFTAGLAFIPETTLLAPIGAGIFMGIGIGIVMRGGGTSAGSDIIAQIMHKYLGVNIASSLLAIDMLVVLASVYFIGVENAFLTLVNLYIQSRMLDYVLEGLNQKKALFIISKKFAAIAEAIEEELGRGITILHGKGYYTDEPKEILYVVVTRQELLHLNKLIHIYDPQAFVTINDITNVSGEGFSYISPEQAAFIRDRQNRRFRQLQRQK